jgi:opine dehydrogenase
MTRQKIREIAIIGAGNGGCAAAADLTLREFSVRLYGRSLSTIAPLRERGGVEITGVLGDHFVPIARITDDAGEAVAGADLVILMGPTHAHEAMAKTVVGHLHRGQVVMAAPGHTVLLVPDILREHGRGEIAFCDTATLPYIARKSGPAVVRITQAARFLIFAAFPGRRTAELAERIRPVYPTIQPGANLLETVFPYTNAVHHPPATLCNAGRIDATGGDYYHYYDGISPAVGRLIDALDRERTAIAHALKVRALPFPQQFFRMGYTTALARDSGLAYECFHQSEPDRWIRAPASLDHRFLNEDIPYGLVLLSALGRLAGAATPTIDHTIELACVATGKDFRAQGLTLDRVGLAGMDAASAIRLLDRGYSQTRH